MDQRPQSEDIALGEPASLHEALSRADASLAAAAEDAGGRAAPPEPPPPAKPVPAASEQPKRAKPPTRVERQVKAWTAEKDQLESSMAAKRADLMAKEESAIAAIRQIEGELDAARVAANTDLDQDGAILGGLIAAIEAAAKAQGGAA